MIFDDMIQKHRIVVIVEKKGKKNPNTWRTRTVTFVCG